MTTLLVSQLEKYLHNYRENEYVLSGLLSICDSLSNSRSPTWCLSSVEDGRLFLCAKHIFHELFLILLQYPQSHDILLCCIHLVFQLNSDSGRGR